MRDLLSGLLALGLAATASMARSPRKSTSGPGRSTTIRTARGTSSRTSRRRSTSRSTGIPGERAFRIKAHKGANPWDVQASSPVAGRHQRRRRGHADVLRARRRAGRGRQLTHGTRAARGRAIHLDDGFHDARSPRSGRATARIASPPHRCRRRRAACRSISRRRKQVIELGPVFVFNFGRVTTARA